MRLELRKKEVNGKMVKDLFTDFDQFSGTVLIAEDDSGQRELYRLVLKSLNKNITFITVDDGKEALEITKTKHPDVVIADVQMPGMSGIKLCHEMKADPETKNIPILLISAFYDAEHKAVCLKAGAEDLLYKPLNANLVNYHLRVAIIKKQLFKKSRQLVPFQEEWDREIVNKIIMRIWMSSEMLMESVGNELDDRDRIILNQIAIDSHEVLKRVNTNELMHSQIRSTQS